MATSRCKPSLGSMDPETIRRQVERVLESPLFRNSKRYPALLRRVTELGLEGRIEGLKEKALGVDVFGRAPNYDTEADPIVRVTAAEVRKRLAQYYVDPRHAGEILIQIPAGSYVPDFQLPPQALGPVPAAPEAPAAWRSRRLPLSTSLAALCAIGALLIWRPWASSALDLFWAPVLDAPGRVLICVGQASPASLAMAPDTHLDPRRSDQFTGYEAADPKWRGILDSFVSVNQAGYAARIGGLLAVHGRTYVIKGGNATNLDDLKGGPAVVIGEFSNDWTRRLLQQTRFSFQSEGQFRFIRDRQKASRRDLGFDSATETVDFAIISRRFDPVTGQQNVVFGGIRRWGTSSAATFLSDPKYLAAFAKNAPRDWDAKNIQIVLRTSVVNGHEGVPVAVAWEFW